MKQRRGLKIFAKAMFMMFVVGLVLPSSGARGASTILMPGDSMYIVIADPSYFTASVGECKFDEGGYGDTNCEDVWLRAFKFNGSGFQHKIWTDANRRGFYQIWVDGVQYYNLTFNYFGPRNPEVTGLTPGIHEVVLRVDSTVCASASSPDCNEYEATGRPDNGNWNEFIVYGPGDLDPPVNPANAVETHGVVNGVWQNAINMAEFTWPAGTDAMSGVAGYEVYFGADSNGTSTDFQVNTTYTTAAPFADGTYYLRLRTKDNAENYAPWVTLFTFRVDTTSPMITVSRTGTAGLAGWWTTPVGLSAVVNDAHSGVASSSMIVDSGTPQAISDLSFSVDGTYQVVYSAVDNAGNVTLGTAETVWVDQTLPDPFYDVITTGPSENGWYANPVIVIAMSSDATSGIATDEVEANGSGAWAGSVSLDTSGVHSINQRVADVAGLSATAGPDSIRIDLNLPTQNIIQAPSQGQVVTGAVMDFVGNSTDGLSGLRTVEYQVEGGAWTSLAVSPTGNWEFKIDSESLDDGLRTIAICTEDMAGNIANWQVQIDVRNPKPAPAQIIARIFTQPTATPLPSPTPTPVPSPTPVIEETKEEPVHAAVPAIATTPTLLPTAQPAPVIYEVEAPNPINVIVGLSALPMIGLLTTTLFLFDPRPAKLKNFINISRKAAPDIDGLNEMVTFVNGSLAHKNSDKGEK
jgi:hypothetical protein